MIAPLWSLPKSHVHYTLIQVVIHNQQHINGETKWKTDQSLFSNKTIDSLSTSEQKTEDWIKEYTMTK